MNKKVKTFREDKPLTRKRVAEDPTLLPETMRAQTPGKSSTSSKNVQAQKYAVNKFSNRKYFKVSEDWLILSTWKGKTAEQTSREISDTLSTKMEHTSESIRDRVKRYLSRLSTFDEQQLEEESKVTTYFLYHMGANPFFFSFS